MASRRERTSYENRTYEAGLAPLLVVAPTARELGGLVGDRAAGFSTAVVGIGHRAAPELLRSIEEHRPGAILSLGFAGALAPGSQPGQIILHDSVVTAGGSPPIEGDAALMTAAHDALAAAGMPFTQGRLLTAPEPLLTAASKLEAGQRLDAQAVDMEGHALAAAAQDEGIPLLSVGAVLDEAERDLPRFVADIVADGGRREWWHTLRGLREPLAIRSLIPLARGSRTAARALRRAADILAPALAAPLRPHP